MLKRDITIDRTINESIFHAGLIFFIFGNLINWLLYGVLTVQLYLYYLAFPNDKKWTKFPVYTVYFLETIQVIGLAIILAYIVTGDYTLIVYPGYATLALPVLPKPFMHAVLVDIVGGIVPLIAQFMYAHRVQIVTRNKVTPFIIRTIAILQIFSLLIYTSTHFVPVILCWAFFNALNDLVIAFIMTRGLLKERILSRYTRLKVIQLVYLVVATGSLTAFFNFITLVTFLLALLKKDSYWHDGFYIPIYTATAVSIFLPKLYANSILVVLNSRMKINSSRNATLNRQSAQLLSMLVIADRQTMVSDVVTDVGTTPTLT